MRVGRLGLLCAGLAAVVAGFQAREISILWSTPEPVRLEKGDLAPPLRFHAPDGTLHDLADLRGGPVVVTFWASWCLPCRAEMPELAKALTELNVGAERPLKIVAINTSDDPAQARPVLRDPTYAAFQFGVDPDGTLAKAWGARGLPTTVLVGVDGKVVYSHTGFDMALKWRLKSWLRKEAS